MYIAFILPSLANKGPIIVAKDLCEEYIRLGHTCIMFYFNDIRELDMPCTAKKISFGQLINFSEYDIVHSHCFIPDLYVGFHHKQIIKGKCKSITTLHNPISFSGLKNNYDIVKCLLLSIGWRWALPYFNHVVVLNEYIKSKITFVDVKQLSVIFNGRNIPTEMKLENTMALNDILRLKLKYKIIGTVSSVDKRKNISQIIRALPQLKDFAYLSVGDGPQLSELKELACRLNVSDRCVWIGYTSNAWNYYQYMDIFAMCSKSEGFPLAFIEAAAFGKSIVLSDIPIFKSIVSDDMVCFYHLGDDNSFIEAINKADKNTIRMKPIIEKYYNTFLTKEVMAKRYLNLYKQLINC